MAETKAIKVGCAWKKGNAFSMLLTGEDENVILLMLPNMKKYQEKSPDFKIFAFVPKTVDIKEYEYCFNYKPRRRDINVSRRKDENNDGNQARSKSSGR